MTERATRSDQIALIDRIVRDIAWHSQKQATHTLIDPTIDLTLPQMITLFAIHDSGSCRMSNLADATQQSAGTLTGIVDRLIADRLVERTRNEVDRRVVEVELTDEGERRLVNAIELCQENTRRALENFGDQELLQFATLLQRFQEGIQGEQKDGHLTQAVEA